MRQILTYILKLNYYLELKRKQNKLNRLFSYGSEFLIDVFKNPFFKAGMEYAFHRWRELGFNYSVATLSFDCDLKEDYDALPLVLTMLRKLDIKASFAIIGKWIEVYPDIHRRIIAEGHEIINHTYTHPNNEHFSPDKYMVNLSLQEKKEEIARCHEVCEKILKYSPVGYRAPHLGSSHGMEIYPVLKDSSFGLGLTSLKLSKNSHVC